MCGPAAALALWNAKDRSLGKQTSIIAKRRASYHIASLLSITMGVLMVAITSTFYSR